MMPTTARWGRDIFGAGVGDEPERFSLNTAAGRGTPRCPAASTIPCPRSGRSEPDRARRGGRAYRQEASQPPPGVPGALRL